MWDVVGVGANSLDYVYVLPHDPRSDELSKLPITSHRRSPGGQTATALCTCASMGLTTSYIGTFGTDDNARETRDALERRTVDLSNAVAREGPNPFAVVLLDAHRGERIVLWRRESELALRPEDVSTATIHNTRLVHVDDVDEDAAIRAARAGREAGLPVTSDLERVTSRTMELVEAVTVPIFAESVPATLTGESDPERALRALRGRHPGMLSVTLGRRGAMLLDGDTLHAQPGFQVDVVDTTGAGDVFRGAFIVALLRGDAPADILQFATAAAALSCTRMGAISGIPPTKEIDALLG